MKKIKSFLILCILIFVLFSCSEFSLFNPPVEPAEDIEVRSLTEGGILGSGESITFIIHSSQEDGEALNLDIELINELDESIWSTSITSPVINEELELILPDLEPGQYKLKFLVNTSSGSNMEKEINFFYINGVYAITGITSYPPSVSPDCQTLLEADLEVPQGSNPFIRWSQDGIVIAKGSLEQGLDQITWSAPGEVGVYSIQVELFPVLPPDGNDFQFASSISMSARLYVSSKQALSSNDLLPEASYFTLFHFNGTLNDSGIQGDSDDESEADKVKVELLGNPVFVSEGDHSGYRLSKGSGIRYPRMILPAKDNLLEPFTLTISLNPDPQNADQDILTVVSKDLKDEKFSFTVYLDKKGLPVCDIRFGAEAVEIPSNIENIESGLEHFLSLSFVPSDGTASIYWFFNGIQTAVQEIDTHTLPDPVEIESIIGGENGFNGVITELGVYYKDSQNRASTDPGIFNRAMKRLYGPDILLAEGFDGIYFSDNFSIDGHGYLSKGSLCLEPDSTLSFFPFELSEDKTILEIILSRPPPPGSIFTLFPEDSVEAVLTITSEGEIETEKTTGSIGPVDTYLKIIISGGEITVIGSVPDSSFVSSMDIVPLSFLCFQVKSPEQTESILLIDRIAVFQQITY